MTKTLEIDIRSAEELKLNRRPVKNKTFAVVKIDDKSRISHLNESKGSNPTWNYKTEMTLNGNNVEFIYIEVFCRTGSGHDKKIGEAKIPTKDFTGKYSSPEGYLNCLSYRLRDEFGDKCGIVNVSILVKPDPMVRDYGGCSDLPKIDGYGSRIVTGVPVMGMYQRPF